MAADFGQRERTTGEAPSVRSQVHKVLKEAELGIKKHEARDSLALAIISYARAHNRSPFEVAGTVIEQFRIAVQDGKLVGNTLTQCRSFLEENTPKARSERGAAGDRGARWRRYFRTATFVEEVRTRYEPDYWLEERPEKRD